jgi:hypothetical protein
VGSTLFLLRCSLSIRSAACRLTGGTDGALENQVGSLGLLRAARGLVDLGGLGAVGADMDTVVEISVGDDKRLRLSSPHCYPHRTASAIHNHIGGTAETSACIGEVIPRLVFVRYKSATLTTTFISIKSPCRHLALFSVSPPMAKATAPLLVQSSMGVLLYALIFPLIEFPNLIASLGA